MKQHIFGKYLSPPSLSLPLYHSIRHCNLFQPLSSFQMKMRSSNLHQRDPPGRTPRDPSPSRINISRNPPRHVLLRHHSNRHRNDIRVQQCSSHLLVPVVILASVLLLLFAFSNTNTIENIGHDILLKPDPSTITRLEYDNKPMQSSAQVPRTSLQNVDNGVQHSKAKQDLEATKSKGGIDKQYIKGDGNKNNHMDGRQDEAKDAQVSSRKEPKSFPPGCHWACYIDRYPDLIQNLEHTEDAALHRYVTGGYKNGRSCHCDHGKKVLQIKESMPIFQQSPSLDSACHDMSRFSEYCEDITCMRHNANADEFFMGDVEKKKEKPAESTTDGRCKMLWFSALHESEGKRRPLFISYASFYSAALNSAMLNAPGSLQPVILVGRYGTAMENSLEHTTFGRWAEAWGGKVIYSPRLSFQDHLLLKNFTKGMEPHQQVRKMRNLSCLLV